MNCLNHSLRTILNVLGFSNGAHLGYELHENEQYILWNVLVKFLFSPNALHYTDKYRVVALCNLLYISSNDTASVCIVQDVPDCMGMKLFLLPWSMIFLKKIHNLMENNFNRIKKIQWFTFVNNEPVYFLCLCS